MIWSCVVAGESSAWLPDGIGSRLSASRFKVTVWSCSAAGVKSSGGGCGDGFCDDNFLDFLLEIEILKFSGIYPLMRTLKDA